MNHRPERSVAGKLDGASLTRQVETLVSRLQSPPKFERRRYERVAMPVLLQLTPLDATGEPISEQMITIVGKDISQRGLSFFHDRPLSYRRAVASIDHPQLGRFSAEIDIRWCRFSRPGWYESGGRLIRAIASEPLEPATTRTSRAS